LSFHRRKSLTLTLTLTADFNPNSNSNPDRRKSLTLTLTLTADFNPNSNSNPDLQAESKDELEHHWKSPAHKELARVEMKVLGLGLALSNVSNPQLQMPAISG